MERVMGRSFGKARQEAEQFVKSFTDVFVMERKRINGDEVWLYKAYPGEWQVHFIWPNGKGHLLAGTDSERPSYDRILDLLRRVPGSQASQSWIDRISATLRAPPPLLIDSAPPANAKPLHGATPSSGSVPAMASGETTLPGEAVKMPAASAGIQRTRGARTPGSRQEEGEPLERDGMGEEASLLLELGNGEPAWGPDEGEDAVARRRSMDVDIDIITGQPVRDIRMEPVLQMARWQKAIFGNGNHNQGPS
jgi:Domain of unknown function (DUF1995)